MNIFIYYPVFSLFLLTKGIFFKEMGILLYNKYFNQQIINVMNSTLTQTSQNTHGQLTQIKEQTNLNQMSPQQFFQRLFDKYDSNRDGRLTWFEFSETFKFLTKVIGAVLPNKHDLQDIFARIDQNGDNSVTKEEYSKLTQCIKSLIQNNGIKLLCRTSKL